MGGTFGGTDTGLTVSGGLVSEGEFTQVPADHVELDFDWVEDFAVVDSDDVADHLWHDDAVSEVGLDDSWLFTGLAVLFRFFAFVVESVIFVFDFYVKGRRYFWRIFFSVWL